MVGKSEVEKVHIKHTIEHHSATPNNRLGDLPHGSKGFRFGYSQTKCQKKECFQCNLLQYIFGEFVPAPAGLGILNFGEAVVNTGIFMLALKSAQVFQVPFYLKAMIS